MQRSPMPKTNCSKFLARNHFSLENGKLEFNLENEGLENRHYKTDVLLGTRKDAILRIMTVLQRLLYLFIIFGTTQFPTWCGGGGVGVGGDDVRGCYDPVFVVFQFPTLVCIHTHIRIYLVLECLLYVLFIDRWLGTCFCLQLSTYVQFLIHFSRQPFSR